MWRSNMNKREIATIIRQEFAEKRWKAEQKCENYIEKLKEDDQFKTLYLNYNIANLNLIKAKHISNDVENAEKNQQKAENELKDYMKKKGLNFNKLKPQYSCKKCQDTGIVNGKMCNCLSNAIAERINKENSSYNNFHTFDMINSAKMNENSEKIYKDMYNWCESFPNQIINISLLGVPGSGKTFLLECITSKLVQKGCNVVFCTAFDFNEECRKYHLSQPSKLDSYLNCDALIIDDLGTEPVLKNITQEYFYNVINLRQINNKATLISTNLSPEQLVMRYSMRTMSRLNNKQLSKSYFFSTAVDKRTY